MRGEARGDSTCNLQENSSVFEFNAGNPYNRLFLKRRRIPKENGHSEDILMKTLRSAFQHMVLLLRSRSESMTL